MEAARTLTIPADLPYDPFRESLYTRDELMAGWQAADPGSSLDGRIQRHVLARGYRAPPAEEALAQRLHDHAIDVALSRYLASAPARRVVGVMGSAAALRTDAWYRHVAELGMLLARAGFLVASGGGPGMMEAANLGAFLSPRGEEALGEALEILAACPSYADDRDAYVRTAVAVRERFGPGGDSLAIPTWFYAGEPVGQFASHIAKYFANSIREDGLLSIAVSGVVFSPGRAGTIQELFQDAAQNAYGIKGPSPMVLLSREYYAGDPSIYDVLREQARRFGSYHPLVTICDNPREAVEFIELNQPREAVEELATAEPEELLSFVRNERARARR
jgi:predicted Rossmann-fold nucleotide-binding protein